MTDRPPITSVRGPVPGRGHSTIDRADRGNHPEHHAFSARILVSRAR
nr:hypothetical protein [Candidatus Sigynarchaeum springense]MDO8118220.1 hypothetical protein [Candidatus Sigynarchaeota archaeon]